MLRRGGDLKDNFIIKMVSWQTHADQLKALREQVFMKEQQVPEDMEWDGLDAAAVHLLAMSHAGEAIGCARLPGDGSIGRMAVLQHWRGMGVGSALLARAVTYYRQENIVPIKLSAQMHAIPFYEKAGFQVCSAPYLDANIMHVDMRLA